MSSLLTFGPALCGDLESAARQEWIVTDGLGGFAMGTVAGLRARRYHGLLVVANHPPPGRHLGLAALDATLVIGEGRVRLATDEWQGGTVDPAGHLRLAQFEVLDSVPRWTWAVGDVVLQREVAMTHGRAAVAVNHRLLRAPGSVRLELSALCTWRDQHSDRFAGPEPAVEPAADGFTFEGAYRVAGPGFEPGGEWFRGIRYRAEAERGLGDGDDLWHAGTFRAELRPGQQAGVLAWAAAAADPPPPASKVVDQARARSRRLASQAKATDETDRMLVLAADQFIAAGPSVMAGYPWFGEWSRDTMTSFEGLLLSTNRLKEARALLGRAAGTLSEGMLANTADVGQTEYNTADATLWFLHAVGRYVEVTGDDDLAAALLPALEGVIHHHLDGTRYGIHVDPGDGLLAQGATGCALTWMDARVAGQPITQRAGKAVEINALWIRGLSSVRALRERLRRDGGHLLSLETTARGSFRARFWDGARCLDVVDGDPAASARLRPSCLLSASLPDAPLVQRGVVDGCGALLTPLGLRSLASVDPAYRGRHRGRPEERDAAYHQGTVWPWLIGPYVEAAQKTGVGLDGVLDGLEAHLAEWGLGSVSETADGDAPHAGSGCPFQAWSVAETLRARRMLCR
jgi:predicted glycogen debranching enzyme